MLCGKLSTTQISFYLIRIWTLNTLCFNRLIREIANHKDFPLKFFHKKAFLWQFDKIKKKFLFAHQLCFYKNKVILGHCALNFFPCNAKQEINLTLPNSQTLVILVSFPKNSLFGLGAILEKNMESYSHDLLCDNFSEMTFHDDIQQLDQGNVGQLF